MFTTFFLISDLNYVHHFAFILMILHTLLLMWILYVADCYLSGGDLVFPLSLLKKCK